MSFILLVECLIIRRLYQGFKGNVLVKRTSYHSMCSYDPRKLHQVLVPCDISCDQCWDKSSLTPQRCKEWILIRTTLVSLAVAWDSLTSVHVSAILGLWGMLNGRVLWQMGMLTTTKLLASKCWFSIIYQGTPCFITCQKKKGYCHYVDWRYQSKNK